MNRDIKSTDTLITQLRSVDEKSSAEACENAHRYGPAAIRPLAALITDPDFELARKAKRALQKIVRHAGRPSADQEARAVERELIAILQTSPAAIRRTILWELSEIGTDRAVPAIAAQLRDKDAREDARCVLLRLSGKKPTAALKHAFGTAPEDFKFALADALRQRGQKMDGYPSRKLVPTAQTTVVAIAPKQ